MEEEDQVVPTMSEEESEREDFFFLNRPEKVEISQEDWDILFKKGRFKKDDMDMLVMDFLVNKEFARVAEAFHRESGCPVSIQDLSILETQATVRDLIFRIQLDEAIDFLNEKLGPNFLADLPRLQFHIEQQKMIELCRRRDFEAALAFSRKFIRWESFELEDDDFGEECRETLLLMLYGDDTESRVADLLNFKRIFFLGMGVVNSIIIYQGRKTDNLIERALRMLRVDQQWLIDDEFNFPTFNFKFGYPEHQIINDYIVPF